MQEDNRWKYLDAYLCSFLGRCEPLLIKCFQETILKLCTQNMKEKWRCHIQDFEMAEGNPKLDK